MSQPTSPDPGVVARLALQVAWCAMIPDASVYGERVFVLGAGDQRLEEAELAARLARMPKPLRIDALQEPGALRIHATPLAPGSPEERAFREAQRDVGGLSSLTAEEDPAYPGILVYAAGTLLRIGPGALEAFNRDYWMGVPAFTAADLPGSPFVADLGLSAEELEGVSEVIVLGRMAPEGGLAPIRPRPGRGD